MEGDCSANTTTEMSRNSLYRYYKSRHHNCAVVESNIMVCLHYVVQAENVKAVLEKRIYMQEVYSLLPARDGNLSLQQFLSARIGLY